MLDKYLTILINIKNKSEAIPPFVIHHSSFIIHYSIFDIQRPCYFIYGIDYNVLLDLIGSPINRDFRFSTIGLSRLRGLSMLGFDHQCSLHVFMVFTANGIA